MPDRSIYHCAVVCDASGRFWWRDQMDDGTKLKPWGAPPVTGVFAIAFEVPPPVAPHARWQGATLVAFVPNNDAFSVSFEQVGTGPNGNIRGSW